MSESETSPRKELKGVGGWLLFFCFGQVVFAPQSTIRAINSFWDQIGPHPFPVVRQIAIIITCEFSAIAVYGFVVGILIWRGSKRGRTIARQYLVVRAVLAAVTLLLLAAWANYGFGPAAADKMLAAAGPMTALELGVLLLWLAYFTYSKRVWNTYCAESTEKEAN